MSERSLRVPIFMRSLCAGSRGLAHDSAYAPTRASGSGVFDHCASSESGSELLLPIARHGSVSLTAGPAKVNKMIGCPVYISIWIPSVADNINVDVLFIPNITILL